MVSCGSSYFCNEDRMKFQNKGIIEETHILYFNNLISYDYSAQNLIVFCILILDLYFEALLTIFNNNYRDINSLTNNVSSLAKSNIAQG